MPELPEVETVRRGLVPLLVGRRLSAVARDPRRRTLRRPVPERALADLCGARLAALDRRGKVLIWRFAASGRPPAALLWHLGMTGALLVDVPAAPWHPHEHLRLFFGRRCLRFVDPRRFGSVECCPVAHLAAHPRLARLGPEPLSDAFDGAVLSRAARGRRIGLRDFLIDGRTVAGVGNIYANEALFRAGLRPGRAAGRLGRAPAHRLAAAVKAVLAEGLAAGGSTLADGRYVDALGRRGWFQVRFAVYQRDGTPCSSCGATIRRLRGSPRGAFYCPRCQR